MRIILLSFLVLGGCATASRLNHIQIGMAKPQVIKVMGRPDSTSAQGNTEYMVYTLSPKGAMVPEPYFVRLIDGKVESYGMRGDFDSTKRPDVNVNVKQTGN